MSTSTHQSRARGRRLLILVDGSSYLYRAFHALPSLTNSKEEPTGAIYGITSMIRGLLRTYDPEYIAIVFDAKGITFRDELYSAYKANRPPMPDALARQLEPIHAIVRALGLPLLEIPGVEADDVIGTLATRASRSGLTTIISTGDKDLAQLVSDDITLVNTMDGSELTPATMEAKFGIPADLIVPYLALIGDTVDNVPGIPKVGPKTAVKWLKSYGSLARLTAEAPNIKGKIGEILRAHLSQLPLAEKLLTIRNDLSIDFKPVDLERRPPDVQTLRRLYAELEFKTWLSELLTAGQTATEQQQNTAPRYETILDPYQLDQWLRRLEKADLFAIDTETTSLDYMTAEIVGLSFSIEPGHGAYVPVGHDYLDAPKQLPRTQVLERFRPLLESSEITKVGQNLKYDISVLARHGITLRGGRFDTMLESYVLDSTASRHDMDTLALKYLGYRTTRFEDIAGKGPKQLSFDQIELQQAAPYAAEDADITLRLHQLLWPRLCEQPSLQRLFTDIEIPLVPVLSRIERNGVCVDAGLLEQQSRELAQRLAQLEKEACAMAGEPFNLGSPKQIQYLLFDKLKLPVRAKTPTGQPSTAESVLQDLALNYPLPQILLEHRSLSKLKSTYTDVLPTRIHSVTGRVHTSYHQAVASTGRLSSSEPNLQNIPVRTPEGRRIRQAFIAAPGYRLLAADYSQIELRIMAHLSGDEGLKQAFAQGADIHRITAAEVFGLPVSQVTEAQRRSAKAINFGLIYGMSAFGLGRQLGIPREEAQNYVDLYFARYPGVKAYMDAIRQRARQQGYVETVFGRRLHVPEIGSQNTQRRQYAERTAINAPMQGTAADIIKRAMVSLDRWIEETSVDARMIMQVHDELVFEVADNCIDTAREAIVTHMTSAAKLSVELVVDVGVGRNWDEAH
ncbi:MAG: DNA polymerase I [Gammaproteobacteria bacterium]